MRVSKNVLRWYGYVRQLEKNWLMKEIYENECVVKKGKERLKT